MAPLDYGRIPNVFDAFGAQTVRVTSVLALEPALWSRESRHRLRQLSEMPENWNGYGSPKIHPNAVQESFALLTDFAKLGMPKPNIVPVSGGGIQLEWAGPVSEIEIEVLPDRSIHYLIVDSIEETIEGRIVETGNVAELTPLTCWFLSEKKSVKDLVTHARTF